MPNRQIRTNTRKKVEDHQESNNAQYPLALPRNT